MDVECWWMTLKMKPEICWDKHVPVPLCPPQIPHGPAWHWIWASTMRSWQLTAWVMARPPGLSRGLQIRHPVITVCWLFFVILSVRDQDTTYNYILLGCDAASVDNWVPAFWGNVVPPSWKVEVPWKNYKTFQYLPQNIRAQLPLNIMSYSSRMGFSVTPLW